jgi:hypothetical protein
MEDAHGETPGMKMKQFVADLRRRLTSAYTAKPNELSVRYFTIGSRCDQICSLHERSNMQDRSRYACFEAAEPLPLKIFSIVLPLESSSISLSR